ncbi:MAG: class I SAM-dependent methyltransferase [Actinomycetota bacterium]
MSDPFARWAEQLAAWAIPPAILAVAPESPYGFPTEVFRSRARRSDADGGPSSARALEALAGGGVVLDVGAGGGAASLPLAPPATRIVAVDPSADLLAAFAAEAASRGVPAATVEGPWPAVADMTEPADVVVCHHVVYNVADLAPFVRALDDHARRRVVVELTDEHPLAWMRDLWLVFHGIERPAGPTAEDAREAIASLGIDVRREDRIRPDPTGGFAARADAIALVRRRLCLPAELDDDVEERLGDRLAETGGLWSAGPRDQVVSTLWWDAR